MKFYKEKLCNDVPEDTDGEFWIVGFAGGASVPIYLIVLSSYWLLL